MTPREIGMALAEPFPPTSLGWKPQAVSGNRALAVAYIDSRDVMQRLDDVVGLDSWQDSYEQHKDGLIVCTLCIRFGESWIQKVDVGGPSDQKDAGDRMKSAFSDALKRAAVKFGIGRYLYALPSVWVDYDPAKKAILHEPNLPAWALPRTASAAAPAPVPVVAPQDVSRSAQILSDLRGRLLVAQTIDDLRKIEKLIQENRNALTAEALAILRVSYRAALAHMGERQPGEDSDG